MKKNITCPQCDCSCVVIYKEDEVEGTPIACPFCGEVLDENDDDDYDDDNHDEEDDE